MGKIIPQKRILNGNRVFRTTLWMLSNAKINHIVANDHRINAMQMHTVYTMSPALVLPRNGEELFATGSSSFKFSPIKMIEKPACPVGPSGTKVEITDIS